MRAALVVNCQSSWRVLVAWVQALSSVLRQPRRGSAQAFKTDAGIFEAERRPDRSGAKDLALTWVTSTTIPTCD